MARSKRACIVFFDEVDAIGGARFDDGKGGDREVQRTMLEIVNQLDGFDARGNIKVMMATNRLVGNQSIVQWSLVLLFTVDVPLNFQSFLLPMNLIDLFFFFHYLNFDLLKTWYTGPSSITSWETRSEAWIWATRCEEQDTNIQDPHSNYELWKRYSFWASCTHLPQLYW